MRLPVSTVACFLLLWSCKPKVGNILVDKSEGPSQDTIAASISTEDIHSVQLEEVILEPPPPQPDTLLYYKQSGCFGRCPVFDVLIWNDGQVHYQGKRHVKNTGKYTIQLTEKELEEVSLWLPNYKLQDLDSSYPPEQEDWIPDLPSSTTIWKNGPQGGTIFHNHSAPSNYLQFEKVVRSWVDHLKLVP